MGLITHGTTARNEIADRVTALVDAGGGVGKVVIGTAGMATTIVSIPLPATAYGNAAAGVAALNGVPLEAAATGAGVPAEAEVRDFANVVIFEGSVTATGGGGFVELVSVAAIAVGEVVRITGGNYTAAA